MLDNEDPSPGSLSGRYPNAATGRACQWFSHRRLRTDMLKEQAALALGNLAGDNDHNRGSIRESCGIPALVAVPRGGTNVQNEQATRALRPLACGPNDTGDAICEPEGGDIQAMDTISVGGLILRGRTVMGRQGVSGVYRNDDGYTYAGDVDVVTTSNGAANGRGVYKWSDGPSTLGRYVGNVRCRGPTFPFERAFTTGSCFS